MSRVSQTPCQTCGESNTRVYEIYAFTAAQEPVEPLQVRLCVRCARRERKALQEARAAHHPTAHCPPSNELSRDEFIALIDQFWAESGAGEICRRCHEQGTGCCPPMCRYLSTTGCLKKNVFCTSFVCSALLNAIAECDPTQGRVLKWLKRYPGSAEYRLYEMVTRVPTVDREQSRPLLLPERYPAPLALSGAKIKAPLLAMQEEVLEIRRHWHREEIAAVRPVETSLSLG